MMWMMLALALAEEPAAPDAPAEAAPVVAPQAVADACGKPYELVELAFTFIVEKGGDEKVRRTHRWRPGESSVQVTTADGTVDVWTNPPPSKPADPGYDAWSAFVNDSYWLIAPCKVTDAGVNATSAPGRVDLSFGEVGITPGDRYQLTVDAEGRVTAWSFELQSGRKDHFSWSPYVAVGPLNLSLERTSTESDVVIRFEDVEAR
ncbi:MAG: hypothetical protein EP330_19460 [Deltaproteobacteria bacterium]|nr:MAG: hypothetical protein EP330_19460 [Deltaproteobacteria bacterium]